MTSNRAMLKSTSSSENGAPGSPVDASAVVFLPEKQGRGRKLTSWTTPRIFKIAFAALPVLLLLTLVIVLVILLTRGKSNHPNKNGFCSFSNEAKRIGLDTFLRELQQKHHTLQPENIAFESDVTPDEIRQIYRPYDPSPSAIKNYTDEVRKLHDRLEKIIGNSTATRMKLRENKAMYVAQHLLKTSFDWGPYERNYYAGDWMFEPNMYCWQPICNVLVNINKAIRHFIPRDLKGLERIEDLLKKHNETISQYVENLKLGVATGMVRSTESCRAGIHAVKKTFHEIAVYKEKGIFNEIVAKTILSRSFTVQITEEMNNTWYKSRGEGVRASLARFLLDYLGKPLARLIRYLEEEHIRHCLSNDHASGLVKLPVSFVYVDGMIDYSKSTTGRLPTGEKINTNQSYMNYFLHFFTSGGVTPEQLHDKGSRALDSLLGQAQELAKQYTGIEDKTKAVSEFRKILRSRDMFFNSEPFPANESGEEAFLLCSDSTGARAFCPKRWETLQKWINSTKHVAKRLRPKLEPLFYFSNPKKTAPSCGMSVSGEYMPGICFHGYQVLDFSCEESASQTLPFFMDDFGPIYTEYTTTSHEQLPGHHLEVRGYVENFNDDCGDAISWISSPNYLTSFTEGWATYVENPLMTRDTDAYTNTRDKKILLQKYGMLKYQILAALRTVLDTGMNYFRMTRAQAMDLFDKYAWDDSDLARKDITRYQSSPGTVTSYLIGQEMFVKLRERTERELGSSFSLKEFHYQLLRQGELPLKYMERHISRFIACKKDSTLEGCQEILS